MRNGLRAALIAVLVLAGGTAFCQTPSTAGKASNPPAPVTQEKDEKFVVAVLNFEAGSEALNEYAQSIPDLLSAFLSGNDQFQMVERAQIKKILEEMALGASGIVDDASKAKIGRMTGAKFLITGRVFVVGKQLFITAKIMSTETSKVATKMVKGAPDAKVDEVVMKLSEDLGSYMAENGKAMMPKVMTQEEIADTLKKKFEGKTMPKFAVAIPESHVNRPIPDPACETEYNFLLRACNATVINTKNDAVGPWAKSMMKDSPMAMPKGVDEADIAIVGEAFSEYAGTNEKLISVKARLEVKAVDTRTGKILATDRTTATAVDLAEMIAAKSALQEAAAKTALKIIPDAVEEWTKSQPKPEQPKKP